MPARGEELVVHPLGGARWVALAGNFPPGTPPEEESLARLASLARDVPAFVMRFPDRTGALDGLFAELPVS